MGLILGRSGPATARRRRRLACRRGRSRAPRHPTRIAPVIAALLASGALISRAAHGRKHGHPTIFAAGLLDELARVDEASEGMKSVLRAHADAIQDVEIDDPAVLLNLNTPNEYAAALNRG